MSHNTKAHIKTIFTTTLGMASIYIYSFTVTVVVNNLVESYYEK